jgi:hypothetical protein
LQHSGSLLSLLLLLLLRCLRRLLLLPDRSRRTSQECLGVFAGCSSPWRWQGSVKLDELFW